MLKYFFAIGRIGRQYLKECSEVDFSEFNKFLIRVILRQLLKTEAVIPIVIGILVTGICVQAQYQTYLFIPQGSVTSFISFALLQFAAALIIMLICPFVIIIFFNYIGSRIRYILPRVFLPFKITLLVISFAICLRLTAKGGMAFQQKILILIVWITLYFVLMNLYLAYKHKQHPFRLTNLRILFAIIFMLLLIKPLTGVLYHASEMINYIEVNPLIYLPQTNCKLLSRPLTGITTDNNLTINDPAYFERGDQGCYIYGNIVRVGFASDFALIFKKNLHVIKDKNQSYNFYARLNCYSNNCFVEDNIKTAINHDIYREMMEQGIKDSAN